MLDLGYRYRIINLISLMCAAPLLTKRAAEKFDLNFLGLGIALFSLRTTFCITLNMFIVMSCHLRRKPDSRLPPVIGFHHCFLLYHLPKIYSIIGNRVL